MGSTRESGLPAGISMATGVIFPMTNAQGSYRDRSEAGRVLARHVREQIHDAGATVLALPRGGVPVAFEIARVLDAPLDVLVVRKRGVPGQPEPFGAVGQWYRDFPHFVIGGRSEIPI